MKNGNNRTGRVRCAPSVLLLCLIVSATAAQSPLCPQLPPSTSGASRGGVGQDCSGNSTICSRGLLCLTRTRTPEAGDRICRRPQKYEACDLAAQCDDADPSIALACQPVFDIPASAPKPYFPGRTCVQLFGRGQPCDSMYNVCSPGLTCSSTPFSTGTVCVSASRAALGQDCSRTDCEDNLVCKILSDGLRRCATLVPRGQSCNLNDYDASINPCMQSGPGSTACINGMCTRGHPVWAECTLPDYKGQCDNGAYCLKSTDGSPRCLVRPGPGVGPCRDWINTGCFDPDTRCIKGYCGVPNGGQGDECSTSLCNAGLVCLKSSLLGGKFRCTALQDVGGSCDQRLNFTSCKDGLTCMSSMAGKVCVNRSASIGEKCVNGKIECLPGLTCVANDLASSQVAGFEGVCMHVSKLGGVCNSSKLQMCHRAFINKTADKQPLECANERCVHSRVGFWQESCGPETGAACAPVDAIAKLQCAQNQCAHTEVGLGLPCRWINAFRPEERCASGLVCTAFNQPEAIAKCARLALDGERCDYNNFVGCLNNGSSCVRGICTGS